MIDVPRHRPLAKAADLVGSSHRHEGHCGRRREEKNPYETLHDDTPGVVSNANGQIWRI
jgi:hypothetical protein